MTAIATTPLDRAAWLEQRRQSIGASEAAACLGLSPWRTPLELYLDKLGMLPERPPSPRMVWGLRLEPVIAAAYAETTGRELDRGQQFLRHPDAPWMTATLDHRASDRVVELKRVGSFAAGAFGPDGSDEIPHHYYLQVQQQMACAGVELADLAALIGDDDFRIYTIVYDPDVAVKLIEAERIFMDRVARCDPPLPDFTHPTTAELLALIEPDAGKVIEVDRDVANIADIYDRLGDWISACEKDRKEVRARLLHAMGDAATAYLPDGRTMTRKLVEARGYTVEPKSYYRFTIKKGK